MLAAAVARLEGFTFAPSAEVYWQHGYSTENDFIYVTTQMLSAEQLQALSDDVGPRRTLLVCCGAFPLSADAIASRVPNLTVKKIPRMVLQKCEWDHDDYSLNVATCQCRCRRTRRSCSPNRLSRACSKPASPPARAKAGRLEMARRNAPPSVLYGRIREILQAARSNHRPHGQHHASGRQLADRPRDRGGRTTGAAAGRLRCPVARGAGGAVDAGLRPRLVGGQPGRLSPVLSAVPPA